MDPMAEGYEKWWAPVIRPAALKVLDLVAPAVDSGAARIIDIGTGTGTLGIGAVERWPTVRATGVDASGAMLEMARQRADERLARRDRARYRTAVAFADSLPYDEGSFDVAVSSFVLQLVPSRSAALREAQRVLQPGSSFAWVTWMRGGGKFAGDVIADEVLDAAGFDPPAPDTRNGDLVSAEAGAAAMRRAGFQNVLASEGLVEHAWDATGYLGFLTEFDEESLFGDLEDAEYEDITGRIRERLAALSADEMTLRLPIVYVSGRSR
jgi:SAM-dependent methyltransferase